MATPNPDMPQSKGSSVEEEEIAIDIPDEMLNAFQETEAKNAMIAEELKKLPPEGRSVAQRRVEEARESQGTSGSDQPQEDSESESDEEEIAIDMSSIEDDKSLLVDLGIEKHKELDANLISKERIQKEKQLAKERGEEITDIEATKRNVAFQEQSARDLFARVQENDSTEVKRQKREKFDSAMRQVAMELGQPPDAFSVTQLADLYFGGSREEKQKILTGLRSQYSQEEAFQILNDFGRGDAKVQLDTVRAAKFMNKVAEKDAEKFRQLMEAEDIDAFIREEAEKGDELFRDYIERQRESDLTREQALKTLRGRQGEEKSNQPPSITPDSYAKLAQEGADMNMVNTMPPDAQVKLGALVQKDGSALIGPLLARGSMTAEGYEGRLLTDWNVRFDYGTGKVYIDGRHAADKGNKLSYLVDPANVDTFKTVLIGAIMQQHEISYGTENPEQSRDMYEVIANDESGNALPQDPGVRQFQKFVILIMGQGTPERTEEALWLQQLGLLSKAGGIDKSRVVLFDRAIKKYVPAGFNPYQPQEMLGTSGESPNLLRGDLLTLATLWNKDEQRLPGDLGELKKLTTDRLNGKEEWWKERE
ncbi:hypothetical protein COU76_00470 [Candidatus Peregrinibacteria bacterium CG10_big_fil_rev_8_21_14_0_10_49_10]|nr:MAG: hypothetical protein COU76_00470 [Candidatus Peregrinibacteria bacterium CG10_big_fil_rev_8_21_14_0_10_49_10]